MIGLVRVHIGRLADLRRQIQVLRVDYAVEEYQHEEYAERGRDVVQVDIEPVFRFLSFPEIDNKKCRGYYRTDCIEDEVCPEPVGQKIQEQYESPSRKQAERKCRRQVLWPEAGSAEHQESRKLDIEKNEKRQNDEP